jgi:hypothetical protein
MSVVVTFDPKHTPALVALFNEPQNIVDALRTVGRIIDNK